MQIPKRKPSEAENKLTLLFSLNALESASETQLWTFLAERELMEYFPMRLNLHELLDSGELMRGAGATSDQLCLTDQGRKTLALFLKRVPESVRSRVLADAPAFRAQMLQRRQVRVCYDMARRGDYRLRLILNEGELPTLTLLIVTARRGPTDRARKRFANVAPQLLTLLYSAKGEGEAPPEDVKRHSDEEFTAHAVLPGPDTLLDVTLLFPTQTQAERFAAACVADREALGRRVYDLLCGAEKRTDG